MKCQSNVFWLDNPFIINLHFSQIVTEVSTVGGVLNDLIQIEHSELTNQSQLRAMQAVFTALDACKEVVHITDTQHRIQVSYYYDIIKDRD